MKKGVAVFLFAIVLTISFFNIYNNLYVEKQLTGSSITGNATSAGVSVSITIATPPNLELYIPENETYFSATNLWLNYSAISADSVKYNIDGGSNTTLTGNTTFNTTAGTHTLTIFANNSFGNVSDSIVFTVNLDSFAILYDNYYSNASSTDFNKSSYEDIQSISGVVLERSAYGKIAFNQALNLTNDSTYTDSMLNLDTHINISSNLANINTTALPNFNKSATVSLYGLTFTDPGVLRNGEACPASICTEVSYVGGTFIFNVTQFSNYSAYETASAGDSGAGGGGGGSSGTAENFTIDKEQITITLQPGQITTENITITNTGKVIEVIKIENLIKEFILRSDDTIILNPGESKEIELHAIARIDTAPDIYLGKLIISTDTLKKEVLIAVEVESKDLLLDVRAEILKPYKRVLPGEEILSEIRLFNLGGDVERKDVEIEYIIKDYDNKTIVSAHESLAIETQVSFIKRFDISEGTSPGEYLLYVRAVYEDKIASSSDTFQVTSASRLLVPYILGGTLVLVALIWMIVRALRRSSRRAGAEKAGISDYRSKLKRYK